MCRRCSGPLGARFQPLLVDKEAPEAEAEAEAKPRSRVRGEERSEVVPEVDDETIHTIVVGEILPGDDGDALEIETATAATVIATETETEAATAGPVTAVIAGRPPGRLADGPGMHEETGAPQEGLIHEKIEIVTRGRQASSWSSRLKR